MTKSWNINFQSYDSSITAIVAAGFNDATQFTDMAYFSYDDPAIALFTIGEVWKNSGRTDTAFIRQTWPWVKHLIRIGLRDTTVLGSIGQNQGMQDDMMWWAFSRSGLADRRGIECSFINMIWVAGFESAAEIAGVLSHPGEHVSYTGWASRIRSIIETRMWSDSLQRYAYIHDSLQSPSYGGNTQFTAKADGRGGQFVFTNSTLTEGECMPYWTGYAADQHATASFLRAQDAIDIHHRTDSGLRPGSLINGGGYWQATIEITSYLYALAVRREAAAAQKVDWLVRNAPLGGMPETLPTNNRGIQVWMCGTALRVLHASLSSLTTQAAPSAGVRVRESDRVTARSVAGSRVIEVAFSGTAKAAALVASLLDVSGRMVWKQERMISTGSGTLRLSVPRTVTPGSYVVTVRTSSATIAKRLSITK
jgi:hypothetical protein